MRIDTSSENGVGGVASPPSEWSPTFSRTSYGTSTTGCTAPSEPSPRESRSIRRRALPGVAKLRNSVVGTPEAKADSESKADGSGAARPSHSLPYPFPHGKHTLAMLKRLGSKRPPVSIHRSEYESKHDTGRSPSMSSSLASSPRGSFPSPASRSERASSATSGHSSYAKLRQSAVSTVPTSPSPSHDASSTKSTKVGLPPSIERAESDLRNVETVQRLQNETTTPARESLVSDKDGTNNLHAEAPCISSSPLARPSTMRRLRPSESPHSPAPAGDVSTPPKKQQHSSRVFDFDVVGVGASASAQESLPESNQPNHFSLVCCVCYWSCACLR